MRGNTIIAKIKSAGIKRLLVVGGISLILGGMAYWFLGAGQLSKEQKAENKQILDTMLAARVTGGLDSTRIANIEASKVAGKYEEALAEVNKMLVEPNLSDTDKKGLLMLKGPLCIYVRDLDCADSYVAEFGKLVPLDIYYLVDAANLAKTQNKPEKVREYYKAALAEIDKQGGQGYITKLNEGAEVSLDYSEIKAGSEIQTETEGRAGN